MTSTGRFHGFTLALDYTDAEILAWEEIEARQRQAQLKPSFWESWTAFAGLGCLTATLTAALAVAGGGIATRSGAAMAALSFATYWIGLWAPSILGVASTRRDRTAVDEFRKEWHGARFRLSPAGLWLRLPSSSTFYETDAIRTVTSQDGLLLLQLSATQRIALPLRLLQPEQIAALASMARDHAKET